MPGWHMPAWQMSPMQQVPYACRIEVSFGFTTGIRRTGSTQIDFNEDSAFSTLVSASINVLDRNAMGCPRTAPNPAQMHRDFADWNAVRLFAQRTWSGDRSGPGPGLIAPARPQVQVGRARGDDLQAWIVEDTPPRGFFEAMRRITRRTGVRP